MVYEHEIPAGSRLYFGKNAALKRKIEATASEILTGEGFEEIVTPFFSYHQHEYIDEKREMIRLNDEKNNEVTLRTDVTADLIRIVTKRLGRVNDAKKWFYIQPVFAYPTKEHYQVGAEVLGGNFEKVCATAIKIVEALDLSPILQLSNIRIPQLLTSRYGISLEAIKRMHLEALAQEAWVARLAQVDKPEDLASLEGYPEDIAEELEKLRKAAEAIVYPRIVIAPLFYAKMRYYNSLMFRFFEENRLLATGGVYRIDQTDAGGFALYTDECIACKMREGEI